MSPLLVAGTRCLNCDAQVPAGEPLFEINGRFWCAKCAQPYVKSAAGGVAASFGAAARLFVCVLVGAIAWIVCALALQMGFIPATLAAGAASIGLYKLFSISSGDADVTVRRLGPDERARLGR